MKNFLPRLAPAVALCLPLLALAQAGRTDPANARAPAPALRYQSAFADYKPWQDAKPGDWRALNDALQGTGASGGHASHAMPSAPPAAAPAPASKASAPSHGGHHMQGGKP
jgi:hypothetical protein